jgi:hypothetical protein
MVIPKNIALSYWAASLIIDFPDDNIPILLDEKDWRLWGDVLSQLNSFTVNGVPSTVGYDNFQDYAEGVYQAMLNF